MGLSVPGSDGNGLTKQQLNLLNRFEKVPFYASFLHLFSFMQLAVNNGERLVIDNDVQCHDVSELIVQKMMPVDVCREVHEQEGNPLTKMIDMVDMT